MSSFIHFSFCETYSTLSLPTVTTSRFLKTKLYSHFLTFSKSCNNQNSTFGTKRPCVQVTSLRPVKAPGNRVFMRFLGVSVYLWFPAFFGCDPYRDPYGIGRVVFGRLVCPLFYAAAILFRSALYERLGFLTPTFVQKCPNPPVWGIWRVWFLPWLPPLFRSEIGAFLP